MTGARIFDLADPGKESCTHIKLLEYKNCFPLIECRPTTGRTHQTRILCMFPGFPILDDFLHGPEMSLIESNPINNNCNEVIVDIEVDRYKYVVIYCKGTNNHSFEIYNSYICLRTWNYKFNVITCETPWPSWATL